MSELAAAGNNANINNGSRLARGSSASASPAFFLPVVCQPSPSSVHSFVASSPTTVTAQAMTSGASLSAANNNSFTINSLEARGTMMSMMSVGNEAAKRRRSSAFIADRQDAFAKAMSEKQSIQWIGRTFHKRECIKFIPEENSDRCGCGRLSAAHSQLALSRFTTTVTRPTFVQFSKKWSIRDHTAASPTDAYGRIEFQGGTHAHKAHYLRMAFDTDPRDVMHLMERVWNLQRPRLVITIHGGMTNFGVADKLGRLFREGMLKAAETTGAWILTSGVDSGVVRHVAKALDEGGISARMRSKVVTIGIAPWGLLRRRKKLIGRDAQIAYDRHSYVKRSRYAVLNDRHSYFLLVDNGTIGRYGADIVFRKRFEEFLAEKQTLYCGGAHRIPIVCLALEGGLYTLNCIHEYLTRKPSAIPVLICEGSGRVSDLLAIAERNLDETGKLPSDVSEHLLEIIRVTMNYDSISHQNVYDKIVACARHCGLLTVFRLHEDSSNDVDHVILRALLTGQILSVQEQLSLTLAWDRVDMARSEVLRDGGEWCMHALYDCMMDALLLDRVEFVKLLLENGLSLKKFLTFGRLEKLYNADSEHLNTLYHLIGGKTETESDDEDNDDTKGAAFTLPEIGAAIEKLMGNAYRCYYTTRKFKTRYDHYRGKNRLKRVSSFVGNLHLPTSASSYARRKRHQAIKRKNVEDLCSREEFDFRYPFNDLLLWAVLTRRHAMAKCVWQYGEEAMAKALVAIRLYKCMSREAADDYTEVEVTNQLREYAEEFLQRSLELLSHCYQQDDLMTMRLLTAELPNWGHHTCLSLAVIANNKRFLAHPCCQILLAELWHGGLRFRSQSNVKVILAILFPPSILLLDFKTFAQQKFTARAKRRSALQNTNANDSDTTANEMDSEAQDEDDSDDYDVNTTVQKSQPLILRLATLSKRKHSLNEFLRRASATFLNGSSAISGKRNSSSNESGRFLTHPHRRRSTMVEHARDGGEVATIDDEVSYKTSSHGGRESPLPLSPHCLSAAEIYDASDSAAELTPPLPLGVSAQLDQRVDATPCFTAIDGRGAAKHVYIVSSRSESVNEQNASARKISGAFMLNDSAKRSNKRKVWKSRLLDCYSKFVLFYRAPITSFWVWAISFCIFMLLFIYVLLIEFPDTVSWLEYALFFYVLALAMEHFRKLLILESSSFMEKIRVFYNRYWNILTSIAVLTYFIGFAFRFSKPTIHTYSRTILASNSVLWHMKLFDYLGVHPRIGPYITMAGKMIISMSYITVMLLVTLMAFGVVRQSITFPHEKWSWLLVRNVFYKPYFMLYGEVYAGEIDTCRDEGTNCVPGSWIPPLVMVIFLLVANILLVNMLIAIFNNIFNVTNAMSQQVWMFQRYEQVLEYKSTPVVPPPFTPLVHFVLLIAYIFQSRMCRRRSRVASNNSSVDFAIKIYLSENDLKKLHDFEEDCMDDLSRRKTLHSAAQNQHQHIRECVESVDEMSYRISELTAENTILKTQVNELVSRFDRFNSAASQPYYSAKREANEKQTSAPTPIERPKYFLKSFGGGASTSGGTAKMLNRANVLPRARVIPMTAAAPRHIGVTSPIPSVDDYATTPSTIPESDIQSALLAALSGDESPFDAPSYNASYISRKEQAKISTPPKSEERESNSKDNQPSGVSTQKQKRSSALINDEMAHMLDVSRSLEAANSNPQTQTPPHHASSKRSQTQSLKDYQSFSLYSRELSEASRETREARHQNELENASECSNYSLTVSLSSSSSSSNTPRTSPYASIELLNKQ